MLQSISWLQFGLFFLVVGGGYYVYVLVVFYRKEVWNYVSGRKSQRKGEPAGMLSAPGKGAGEGPNEESGRKRERGSGGKQEGSLVKEQEDSSGKLAGKSAVGITGRKVPGPGSSVVGGWPGIVSGSEDALRTKPATNLDENWREDDPDDFADGDLMARSRREGRNDEELMFRFEEEGQGDVLQGLMNGQGSLTDQKDVLFRAMGKVIIQLKEVVRQATDGGTDRDSLINQLSDVLRKYGQLKGTPYQAGINNFLTRSCSTNFSLLLGADELDVMWN